MFEFLALECGSNMDKLNRLFKRKLLLGFCMIAAGVAASVSAQTIYKVVQEDGTILYTDQPVPGSRPLDLSSVNFSSMPRLAVPPSQPVNTDEPEGPSYSVNILSPAPEATIRDNNGRMAITAAISPKLDSGQFHLWLDNKRVASQNFGSFILDDLNRGAHTFFVSVTDNTGKTLASSDPQTFYMHQASVLIRPSF
jgi:hypothetical protein